MADKTVGKVTPTIDGEWARGVKYLHPCFVTYENTIYLSTEDNINEEPGISNKWSYFIQEGGGGTTVGEKFKVNNTSGWSLKTVTQSSNVNISFNWLYEEDDIPVGDGTMSVIVGSTTKARTQVEQGNVTVNLTPYLTLGENVVKINITNAYGKTKGFILNIEVVSLSIESTFNQAILQDGDIIFRYTPFGNAEKTVHFIVDGDEYTTVNTTASNRQLSQTIEALEFGSHTLDVYFTAELDGETVSSNVLHYEVISVYGDGTNTIISTDFSQAEVAQYQTIKIGYQVYDPSSITADVVVKVNNIQVAELNVDRTQQQYTYKANTMGSMSVSFTCGTTVKEVNFTVVDSGIHVEAETQDLSLFLTAEGRSNAEANPAIWVDSNNNISATLSGFNWVSNGWIEDGDGIVALHIENGASVTIPYKIFANDFRAHGKTIEFEFAAINVLNYNTVIMSCMSGGRGIEITPQLISLTSEGSHIEGFYKEDEHVRISFVVEPESKGTRLIHCYINGIDSGLVQYPVGDNFSQVTPVDLTIGSNLCGVDIYKIRVYDNALSSYQIVDNWIADTEDVNEMAERYARNNIFDEYGEISIGKLPSYVPYLVLQVSDYMDLPQYKGDKKKIKGYYVDPSGETENFTFENVEFNVQGTSSQYYARKNYKASWKKGTVTMESGAIVKALPINGGIAGPVWCLKADVASSEGANNVELVRLWEDINPYRTPYQKENAKVRQGIDGFPGLIFWEDDDHKTHFLGKYNMNYDKSSENVFGFSSGDESWETKNNTSDHTRWKSDDFESTGINKDGEVYPLWQDDFEARYPEDNTDISNLKSLATWLKSTARDIGDLTDEQKAARLEKFRTELKNYMEVDDIIFKYVFAETFMLIDNWAKNSFLTLVGGSKWLDLPYDLDTACGINNEGELVFNPFLEDIDQFDGADVYNGQDSTLWRNIRDAFYPQISSMYNELRATGKFSYEAVSKRFTEHQAKWSENIFNEDGLFKYIQPLIDDGTTAYLDMLQGSKAEQRKYWLYNRFKYLDSKYIAGDSASDVITLRGYAKADIGVTPFQPIYVAIKYGSSTVHERGQANVETVLSCPLNLVNDTETYIYSASQIKAITDLTGYKVGYADFAKAIRLQNLVVHRGDENNTNTNLTNLSLGNNKLLQTLVCTYTPNLKQNINLSGCIGLKSIDFTGTGITGVTLANGAAIEEITLPNTITNLTLRNTSQLNTLEIGDSTDYSHISTLWVENVPLITEDYNLLSTILDDMSDGSRIRLMNINLIVNTRIDLLTLFDLFDKFIGLDENGNNVSKAQVSGNITVGIISSDFINYLRNRYPYLSITGRSSGNLVTFMNSSSQLFQDGVEYNGTAVYPLSNPQKASTTDYDYEFSGWGSSDNGVVDSTILNNIITNKTVYAEYTAIRFYHVSFMNNDNTELLYTDRTMTGNTANYDGIDLNTQEYEHTGWHTSPNEMIGLTDVLNNITNDKTVYAAMLPRGWNIIYWLGREFNTLSYTANTYRFSPQFTRNDSSIYMATDTGSMTYDQTLTCWTNDEIDLTNYSKIIITGFVSWAHSGGGSGSAIYNNFGITNDETLSLYPTAYKNINQNIITGYDNENASYERELDISDVVGNYRIFLTIDHTKFYLYKIYLTP